MSNQNVYLHYAAMFNLIQAILLRDRETATPGAAARCPRSRQPGLVRRASNPARTTDQPTSRPVSLSESHTSAHAQARARTQAERQTGSKHPTIYL
eukprot:4715991-Pleurochrysis_carterae.AAC.1